MRRGTDGIGLVVAAAASLCAGCPGRGDTTAAPSADAVLTGATLCLPKSSCGCFGGECVAGRLEPRDELANRVVLEGEPNPDAIGLRIEVCPDPSNDLTECIQMIDVSLTCTVTCTERAERFVDPGYRCGFRSGACGRL